MVEGFEPIIHENCEILILGTMPGAESLIHQEYYGNRQNQFWKIVFSLFGEEMIESYDDKMDFLLKNHIAIYDVLKSCDRVDSSDSNIKNPVANDFKSLFIKYPNLKSIYFNGKKAEALYKKLVVKNVNKDDLNLFNLPSTSPANAVKLEAKANEWRRILLPLKGWINTDILIINACVGGYGGASYQVDIDILNRVANYKYMEFGCELTVEKKIKLLQDKLIVFISGLEKNKVFKWKNSYEPLHPVCDGTSWSVQMVTKEKNYIFEGNNEYPKEWSKFCRDISLLISEKFC
ncbi:DNA-deoxyinosine glycosylase [Clostridium sp. CS001]|uniref:DNA-deoxyinosine glycosylase n=1 Tax=Clostridium sp. CS001 TaxID=2880648 RepID=UPI001CF46121|nr:DNA-deoxyinosine glycosylase [Clostridium sp. CS001]MCB2290827.1 DNA-deoxyinosine glycosylase [Clostridium sp. CS001]